MSQASNPENARSDAVTQPSLSPPPPRAHSAPPARPNQFTRIQVRLVISMLGVMVLAGLDRGLELNRNLHFVLMTLAALSMLLFLATLIQCIWCVHRSKAGRIAAMSILILGLATVVAGVGALLLIGVATESVVRLFRLARAEQQSLAR